MMTREEFTRAFLELVNKDSPKVNYTMSYRTLIDSEAEKLAVHCFEWFRDQVRYDLATADLTVALLKTRHYFSVQDRAEAISRMVLKETGNK